MAVLEALRDTRPAAFCHTYLVADECSWGIPIAVRLFLNSRSGAAHTKNDILRIQAEVQDLNKWRQQAIASDRAALTYYGGLLTTYYRRLRVLANIMSVFPPGHVREYQMQPIMFDEGAPPPSQQAAEIVKKRIDQVGTRGLGDSGTD